MSRPSPIHGVPPLEPTPPVNPLHPHTACLLEILDRTEDAPVRCMADLQALLGRVRQLAAAALGETLPEGVP